ncbi:hypothetical protein [Dactylosporangium sp. NPDC000521]|uniref:hypothetical protein n=1 Tax=Dactylosporangium sp. NPDC000521 TaxID=3363975 RepID=UPI00368143E9
MTSGNEQRRKRRSDSFRRDEADEADNWLAGLRGSGPDPFTAPPPPSFDEPAFDDLRGGRDGRSRPDDSPSGSFRAPRDDSPSGSFRAPRDDSPSGSFRAPRDSGGGPVRSPRDDSPSGVFRASAVPPPAGPRAPEGGRRRAPGDDSPSGTFRAPRDSGGSPARSPRDDSPSGSFRAPRDSGGGPARSPRDDSPSGSFRTPRDDSPSGSFRAPRDDSPSGSFRTPRDDSPSGTFRASRGEPSSFRPLRDDSAGGAFRPVRDEPTGPRAGRGDSPSGAVPRPATVPPPARAAIEPPPPVESTESRGGRRRARADDEPAGRRAAERRPSESYEHGPALEPIIKPLADYTPPRTSTEPPPLVPIFPTMRPDSSPTSGSGGSRGPVSGPPSSPTSGSGGGRRARRAAEEAEASTGARRRFDDPDSTGRRAAGGVAERPAAGRRARDGDPETTAGRRGVDTGTSAAAAMETGPGRRSRAAEDPAAFRRDDTGTSRRGRGGFEPTGTEPGVGRQRSGPGVVGGPSTGSGYGPGYTEPGTGTGTGTGRRGGFYTGAPVGADRDDTSGLRRDDTAGLRRDETSGFRRDDTAGLRRDDAAGFRRDDTGVRGRGFDDLPPRRDDTGTARRRGFEPTGPGYDRTGTGYEPASAAFEASGTATRRRPSADEAPHQRRPLDDGLPFDEPSGAGRRGRGPGGPDRGTGEYTTGGTKRALRGEPPGNRPAGRPDSRRPGGARSTPAEPARGVEHRPHRWIAALSVIGVIVLLAACGLGSWFIFKDEKNGPESARSTANAGPKKRDISSRQVDPNPLTEAEVFPQNNIIAVPDEPPYLILKTQASPDCKTAATDQLATLLAGAGCSEVVRATMKSPNEDYLITAGIFNLDTEKSAATAFEGVKPIVDGQKGRFAGMSVGAGTGTDAIVRAPTQLGWNYRGHFIAFVVIARVDGKDFAPDDPYPNQITYDIVETYLENGIIGNRAIIQPEATPAASLPASAPPPS